MATLEQIEAALRAADAAGAADDARALARAYAAEKARMQVPTVADEVGAGEAMLIGAGRGIDRLATGAQQLFYSATGNKEGEDKLAQQEAENTRLYGQLQSRRPIATGIGEAAPLLAARSTPAAAALAALEYGTAGERLMRGALGGAGFKAGEMAGRAIGRGAERLMGRATDTAADQATRYGATLTPGQASGSTPMQTFESVLARLPGSAGRMNKVYEAQKAALDAAVMKAAGAQGVKTASRETMDATQEAVGQRLAQLAGRIPQVQLGDDFVKAVAAAETEYGQLLQSQQRKVFSVYVDDILNKWADGKLTGAAYQKIRSSLGRTLSSTQDADYKVALKSLQRALDDAAMQSAGPDIARAIATTRGQYRNLKSVTDLVTPDAGLSAARLATRGAKPGALSPEMARIADFANVIKSRTPDSGTAQRYFWQNLMTNPEVSLLSPSVLLGATGIPYATSQVVTRGPTRQILAEALTPAVTEMQRRLALGGGLLGLGAAGALQP